MEFIEAVKAVWGFFKPPNFNSLIEVVDVKEVEQYQKLHALLDKVKGWGWKISATFAAMVIFAIWSFTPWGFVRAAESREQVKAEVATAIKQLQEESKQTASRVERIETQNARMESALYEVVKTSLATNICRILQRRQRETGESERISLREDIDKEQEKYRAVAREYYPESRCN